MQPSNNIIMYNVNNHKRKYSSPATFTYINNNNIISNNTAVSPEKSPTSPQPRIYGTTTIPQACAACKYQRRRCTTDCVLAPYFPHHRLRQFLNAHRLFGVSNIIKIVKNLEQRAKDHAMHTIIFQAEARAADPVGGCHRIIRNLEHRISLAEAELEIVLHHLALCRAARQQQVVPPGPSEDEDSTVNGDPFGYYNERWRGQYVAENDVAAVEGVEDVSSWGCMHGIINHNNENVHGHAESSCSSFPSYNYNNNNDNDCHVKKLSMEDCDHNEIKPLVDNFSCDDEGEFRFDSHGNIIPSNNGILTEETATLKEEDACLPYVEDHQDLKAAAAFLNLTNYDV